MSQPWFRDRRRAVSAGRPTLWIIKAESTRARLHVNSCTCPSRLPSSLCRGMAATHRLFDRRYTNAFATWPTRLCLLLHEPSPRARAQIIVCPPVCAITLKTVASRMKSTLRARKGEAREFFWNSTTELKIAGSLFDVTKDRITLLILYRRGIGWYDRRVLRTREGEELILRKIFLSSISERNKGDV